MAQDLIRKLGTIAYPTGGGQALPFEIRTTNALKRIFFRVAGGMDNTSGGTALTLQAARFIKSVSMKVNNQPGPFAVDGLALYYQNYFDHGVVPATLDVAAGSQTNDLFSAFLQYDFAFPNYPDGDLTLFHPKLGNVYTIEMNLGTVTDFITGGTGTAFNTGNLPTVEVWAHEIVGLKPVPNKYRASYLIQQSFAAANSAESIKIPYGTLLNELHARVYNATPALSDAIISNWTLRNGTLQTFRDVTTNVLREFTDLNNPSANPTASGTGIFKLDLAINNDFSSLLNTTGMKELELVANVTAAGSIVLLVNELRDGLD